MKIQISKCRFFRSFYSIYLLCFTERIASNWNTKHIGIHTLRQKHKNMSLLPALDWMARIDIVHCYSILFLPISKPLMNDECRRGKIYSIWKNRWKKIWNDKNFKTLEMLCLDVWMHRIKKIIKIALLCNFAPNAQAFIKFKCLMRNCECERLLRNGCMLSHQPSYSFAKTEKWWVLFDLLFSCFFTDSIKHRFYHFILYAVLFVEFSVRQMYIKA